MGLARLRKWNFLAFALLSLTTTTTTTVSSFPSSSPPMFPWPGENPRFEANRTTPSSSSSLATSRLLSSKALSNPHPHHTTTTSSTVVGVGILMDDGPSFATTQASSSSSSASSPLWRQLLETIKQFRRRSSSPSSSSNSLPSESSSKPKMRLIGVNKIAGGFPSFLTNNTRLKRQLEGIFHHVLEAAASSRDDDNRSTTTSLPSQPLGTTTTDNPSSSSSTLSSATTTARHLANRKTMKKFSDLKKSSRNRSVDEASPRNNKSSYGPMKEVVGLSNNYTKPRIRNAELAFMSSSSMGKGDRLTTTTTTTTKANPHPFHNNDDINNNNRPKKRNFTLEIVEVTRKTTRINERNNETTSHTPFHDFRSLHSVTENSSNGNKMRPKLLQMVSSKPLLKLSGLGSGKGKISDSTTALSQDSIPDPNKSKNAIKANGKGEHNRVEISVRYEEQIPMSEKDFDDADLRDYLDGHSTFGAKGDFQHTVSKKKAVESLLPLQAEPSFFKGSKGGKQHRKKLDQTVFLPSKKNALKKGGRDFRKSPKQEEPETEDDEPEDNEKAHNVKEIKLERKTVYTATGIPLPDPEDSPEKDSKGNEKENNNNSVFQYSGNKDKQSPHFPQLPKSTLDELYRQGHPAVAKAPERMTATSSPPPAAPVEFDSNPFRPNPLIDEPPTKYDPESDTFYGNPTPDKNANKRPSKVVADEGVVSSSSDSPQQQPKQEEVNHVVANNEEEDPKFLYRRAYEPPEEEHHKEVSRDRSSGERETDVYDPVDPVDAYIKEFVSLDHNFETLPRPTDEEERFLDLVPPEVRNQEEERRFEPDPPTRNRRRQREEEEDEVENEEPPTRNAAEEDDDDGFDRDREQDTFGPITDDSFDSYQNALKQFDDEIKQIQQVDRSPSRARGSSLSKSNANTEGPIRGYQTSEQPHHHHREHRRSAPPPPPPESEEPATTPTRGEEEPKKVEEQEEEEEGEEEEEAPKEETKKEESNNNEPSEEDKPQTTTTPPAPPPPPPTPAQVEEEEEEEEEEETTTNANSNPNPPSSDSSSTTSHSKIKDVPAGDLEEDIGRIEDEYGISEKDKKELLPQK